MRIAVNARFLLAGRLEGIGGYTYEVVRRIVDQHPEHTFILFFDRAYDPVFVFGPNVIPVVLPPPARHPVLWWWWFEVAIPRALKQHKADVFFSPDGYCSLRSQAPTLMVLHDLAYYHYPQQIPWLARWYYRYFVPRYLQRAEEIVVVSHFVKQDIQYHFPVADKRITVAGNGCKEHFQPLSVERIQQTRQLYADGQSYFFYVGAIHPRKNLDGLIRAFDRFKVRTSAPVKLLIAGRTAWQHRSIRQAWESAQHQEDIIWLGYVPDDQLPLLMGSALALTYVSWLEGFGVPILEAMHAEVPVITSNVTSLPEVAGEAALLVSPVSEEEITEAMVRVYREPALRRELVERGRMQRQRYSWEQTVEVVWGVLEGMV